MTAMCRSWGYSWASFSGFPFTWLVGGWGHVIISCSCFLPIDGDSADNILYQKLHRAELSGNKQLVNDPWLMPAPWIRALTTSPHREATAYGTASGKGRCLRTFITRQRHTYFSMPLTHESEDLKMTENQNYRSISALVHDFLQTLFIIPVVVCVIVYGIYHYVSGLF